MPPKPKQKRSVPRFSAIFLPLGQGLPQRLQRAGLPLSGDPSDPQRRFAAQGFGQPDFPRSTADQKDGSSAERVKRSEQFGKPFGVGQRHIFRWNANRCRLTFHGLEGLVHDGGSQLIEENRR